MKESQKKVADWMTQFGQNVPTVQTMPDLETRKLRAKLMLEECLETIKALGLELHVIISAEMEANGAFVGAEIVVLGTASACGIDAESDFNEVMRSNFSKMWTDEEIAFLAGEPIAIVSATTFYPKLGETHTAQRTDPDGRCWIVKDASGKIIKSPSFERPNFERNQETKELLARKEIIQPDDLKD